MKDSENPTPETPPAGGWPKTWLIIEETEDHTLVAYGPDGTQVVRHQRTIPADASSDQAWAQELVTDLHGLARLAASMSIRTRPHLARFDGGTSSSEGQAVNPGEAGGAA